MIEFFRRLFDSDFMPHGGCYFWRPELVWLAYVMIPLALTQLVRKRKDLEFNWMFVMFGVFILACGATHFMNVWNIWHSAYRLDGVLKAITAFASIPTAVLMFRLVPQAVALPSAEDLRRKSRIGNSFPQRRSGAARGRANCSAAALQCRTATFRLCLFARFARADPHHPDLQSAACQRVQRQAGSESGSVHWIRGGSIRAHAQSGYGLDEVLTLVGPRCSQRTKGHQQWSSA